MALREAQPVGLTDVQRQRFERDGYLVVDGALDSAHVSRLIEAVDRVWAAHSDTLPVAGADPLHLLAFVGRDPLFLELLDHEPVLRLIVDLIGWNVFMHHCHLDVHPPMRGPSPRLWMWHQDGGIQNHDLETHPRPRMSVKVAYFLTDVAEPGRGNFSVIPGSHLRDTIHRPSDDGNDLAGAVPVLARPGTAVLFDRRLWHMRGENRSSLTRKTLFYAYTYRWCAPATTSGSRPSSSEPSRRSVRSCWARARARSVTGCPTMPMRHSEHGGMWPAGMVASPRRRSADPPRQAAPMAATLGVVVVTTLRRQRASKSHPADALPLTARALRRNPSHRQFFEPHHVFDAQRDPPPQRN